MTKRSDGHGNDYDPIQRRGRKDNPRNGWRAKFAAQHFSKSIVMENLGNSREDILQRGVGRLLLNQKFEHELLLALLKKSYGEKKAAEIWNTANRKTL